MRLNLTPVGIMNFFFMLGISFVLTFDETLFVGDREEVEMYQFFLRVSPQEGYGIAAFVTALIFFTAFILKSPKLEILGLSFSGLLQIFILSGYLLSFPNIGSIAFFVWTLACFMTIVELVYAEQDKKVRKERILAELRDVTAKKELAINHKMDYNEIDKYERILAIQKQDELEKLKVLEEEAGRVRKEIEKKEKR